MKILRELYLNNHFKDFPAMAQLAPLKVRVGTTVEEAPSHDGSPTCAAYENRPKGWNRPLFALRVYDTTAHTTSADHVCHAAQVVHEYTMSYHYGIGRSEADRIEVVDLPMAAAATDDERAQKCKEHNLAEIAARSGAGLKDWFLHGTFKTDSHLYLIAVITRSNEGVNLPSFCCLKFIHLPTPSSSWFPVQKCKSTIAD